MTRTGVPVTGTGPLLSPTVARQPGGKVVHADQVCPLIGPGPGRNGDLAATRYLG